MSAFKPVKCAAIRPHLNHSDEVLFVELYPTIAAIFKTVSGNSPKYNLDDAKSDAWLGYMKAKEHDNLPPSLIGDIVDCPKCINKIKVIGVNQELDDEDKVYVNDDKVKIPYQIMVDDCANIDPSANRTYSLKCGSCNHEWNKVVFKSQFTTCVYHYMRGEIQRGARESRRCGMQKIDKKLVNGHKVDPAVISIDVFCQTSDHVCNAISVEHQTTDSGINIEMRNRLRNAVKKLSDRQNEVISRMYGFDYNDEIMEPMNQAQVADLIGISRQRVCAIVSSSMKYLKTELEKYYET
jgi:RNA polymerase sigma factor (sigma-70 family)